jgi:hypothetical protein
MGGMQKERSCRGITQAAWFMPGQIQPGTVQRLESRNTCEGKVDPLLLQGFNRIKRSKLDEMRQNQEIEPQRTLKEGKQPFG